MQQLQNCDIKKNTENKSNSAKLIRTLQLHNFFYSQIENNFVK